MGSPLYDASTQADYAEEPPYHHCEQCGASPAHLFDHTPLEEHGTWERLCNNCIDKTLEQWQSSQQAVDRARATLAPAAGSHETPAAG